MKVPICVIRKFQFNDSASKYSDTYEEIDEFNSVNLTFGYKDKKDTFSISLIPSKRFNSTTQIDEYNVPNIEINDMIDFYMYYEDDSNIIYGADGVTVTNLNDFFVFSGIVDKFNFASNQGIVTLNVTGNNRTEIVLNNLTFFQYTNQIVPNMLAENANKLRQMNPNKPLFIFKDYKGDGTDTLGSLPQAYNSQNENLYNSYIPGYTKWGLVPRGKVRAYKKAAYTYDTTTNLWILKTGINLDELDSNGNYVYRFPEKNYYETYKSLYSHLEILSGTTYTDESLNVGTYITKVDKLNVLYWEPKNTIINYTLKERDTTSTTVGRETRDIVNAIIVNVGNDVNGRGILALAYNTTSMVKYGAKWKYITRSNISEQVKNEQKTKSGDTYNTNDNFPASYPVNVQVPDSSSIIDSTTGQPIWSYTEGEEIDSDANFNTYIRKVSRERGKDTGRIIVDDMSDPRFFPTMALDEGSNEYTVGDYVTVEVPSINWKNLSVKKLRIQEIKHSISGTGWTTTLVLEEDPSEIN